MLMPFDLEPDEQPVHAAMELHRRHISEEQMRTFERDYEQECLWTFLLVLPVACKGALRSSMKEIVRCWLSAFLSTFLSSCSLLHFAS